MFMRPSVACKGCFPVLMIPLKGGVRVFLSLLSVPF